MSNACSGQSYQQSYAGAADIGGCRQDRGVGHGEGQTPEGKTAQWPHRAQLLDARPQKSEGENTPGTSGHMVQRVSAAGGPLKLWEPADQSPRAAEAGQVERLEERQRDPADRVAHPHHREVQQGCEQAEAVEQPQTGTGPEPAASDEQHECPDPNEGRPPQVYRRKGGVGGQARQHRHSRGG